MMKKLGILIRKVIISFLVLYAFNILVNSLNIVIPLNAITVSIVAILGMPGLLSLVALFFIVK